MCACLCMYVRDRWSPCVYPWRRSRTLSITHCILTAHHYCTQDAVSSNSIMCVCILHRFHIILIIIVQKKNCAHYDIYLETDFLLKEVKHNRRTNQPHSISIRDIPGRKQRVPASYRTDGQIWEDSPSFALKSFDRKCGTFLQDAALITLWSNNIFYEVITQCNVTHQFIVNIKKMKSRGNATSALWANS